MLSTTPSTLSHQEDRRTKVLGGVSIIGSGTIQGDYSRGASGNRGGGGGGGQVSVLLNLIDVLKKEGEEALAAEVQITLSHSDVQVII